MNIVDSSGWLEYFSDGPNADRFAAPLEETSALVVPSITLYEVFKVVMREAGENDALRAIAAMQKGTAANLSSRLVMDAARLSLRYQLPMADSIILATAIIHEAVIWTQDADFKNLPKVKYFPK